MVAPLRLLAALALGLALALAVVLALLPLEPLTYLPRALAALAIAATWLPWDQPWPLPLSQQVQRIEVGQLGDTLIVGRKLIVTMATVATVVRWWTSWSVGPRVFKA